MDTKRKKVEDRMREKLNRLEKNNPEIGKHKLETAEKILESLIGKKLGFNCSEMYGNVYLYIFDGEYDFEPVAVIIVEDNKIIIVSIQLNYPDRLCGIDEIDRVVGELNDIVEFSR